MSVVGFDIGNENCVIAVARQRGIDVVLNEESKRETPAVVSFGDKQRLIGTAGSASAVMNPRNSVTQVKRLIGRRFSDPELQHDLQSMPFSVTEGPDGFPLINARYLGEHMVFTPTQVLGMLLSNLKGIAQKNLNAAVVDCCIGIPVYFTDLQRRAVLDAAAIAKLNPLHLIHETTATALAYGIYKTDLPENDQVNVAFVDMGHASMQVCIAGYKKGQLKVLAHAFDRNLGGRDFDEVLFKHFATKFNEQYKLDISQNARACIRLRAGCEKLKKMLSANPEAPLNVECLMDEKDFRGFIRREEFELISSPILQRVKGPLEKALSDAGLDIESIQAVEVVGSGSRVPAIIKILTEFFGKEPRRTMNASECVARGCALQCAILSPTFKVRDFKVHENFPFPVSVSWKVPNSESTNCSPENQQITCVFRKGDPIPISKILTLFRENTFSVDLVYDNASEVHGTEKISTYTIGPFQSIKGERAKFKIKVSLNLHGIVSIESVKMIKEEKVEVPVCTANEEIKDAAKMEKDEDEASNNYIPTETDVNMLDVKESSYASNAETVNDSPDTNSPIEERPVENRSDAKVEMAKRNVKKIKVAVSEHAYGGLSPVDLQKAVEKEFEMAFQDKLMEDTKDKKNAVEAYVYEMRNNLHDKYKDFVTDHEREMFAAKLQEVEDWLYDEGEDETKGVYIDKLEELKRQGEPIEERFKEDSERGPAANILYHCITSFANAAVSNNPQLDHIDIAEKQKVLYECREAEAWLRAKMQQQNAQPKHANPVLLSADLKKKAEVLDRFCKAIMLKPRPAAERPPTPPQPETPEPHPEAAHAEPQQPPGNANAEYPTEPMDMDSSQSAPKP